MVICVQQHIKHGCPVEVNISAITRNRVISQYHEVFGLNDENNHVPKDKLVEWLRPAYNVSFPCTRSARCPLLSRS